MHLNQGTGMSVRVSVRVLQKRPWSTRCDDLDAYQGGRGDACSQIVA